ncbi:hypothetical protein Pla52o_52450 [Novipirellula galeiformis]|uniref:AAA+ ATPase domain-containing protein n=2 Tax=Novipirellula galeiformis TaxID=2528004 RepID=A0A5C6C1D6_9BACT|nr:hypothetical protein Pla52o_52450 [Novipirellula galeiformis]
MSEFPNALKNEVESGNAVLFLGAGASMGCRLPNNEKPPNGQGLADILAKEFLSDDYVGFGLEEVAELAIDQHNFSKVQNFVADFFNRFQPTQSHLKLTSFRWHGIATTNYDLVLERAYDQASNPVQQLKPIYRDGDPIETKLKASNAVAYMKLHGCLSIPNDESLPLILTSDQYEQFRENRNRLFSRLKEWASEFPVLFVGYSLQDKDLRKLLNELDSEMRSSRPRFYLVGPGFRSEQVSLWESKRITAIKMDFDSFVDELDASIGSVFRGIVAASHSEPNDYLHSRLPTGEKLSERAKLFIEADVDVVNELKSVDAVKPESFYQAADNGWGAIDASLDVRRRITDTILERHVVDQIASTETPNASFVLLKGHAGSGKSITMKRLAWEIAREFEMPCLFLKELGELTPSAVIEIARAIQEQVVLFVDDVLRVHRELTTLLEYASDAGVHILVVGSVRQSEFNSRRLELEELVDEDYELTYLSEREIRGLLSLLETHKCLGELESKSEEERFKEFSEHSGRQLLVALHEATHALSFREIICDEFRGVQPDEARQIYKTICVLYRLKTPVRAGLISRIHGVGFAEFSDKFLDPLERIVRVIGGDKGRDYSYVARHSQIADMVYHDAINDATERLEAVLKCLRFLDLDYSADREAFYQLINNRTVLELSKNRADAKLIYDIACKKSSNDAVVIHQQSLYEMKHPSPHLKEAETLLVEAKRLDPNNPTILHSFAELAFNRAKNERPPLRKAKYLSEADEACRSLVARSGYTKYSRNTLVKIKMEQLKLALATEETSDESLARQLKSLETELAKHKRANPNEQFLLSTEAELAKFLSQTERLLSTLEKAFAANPKNLHVAISLTRARLGSGDNEGAESIVRQALFYNEHEPRLHYLLSCILREKPDASDQDLLYHLRRSFTPGDKNYDAQLMHARQLYIMKGHKEAQPYFSELATARVSMSERRKHHFPLDEEFQGRIGNMLATACFIKCNKTHELLFAHESSFINDSWREVIYDSRVRFKIAFNFRGPVAFDVDFDE